MKGVRERDIKCTQVEKLHKNVFSSTPLGIIVPFKTFPNEKSLIDRLFLKGSSDIEGKPEFYCIRDGSYLYF